jgi:hypothetical protein
MWSKRLCLTHRVSETLAEYEPRRAFRREEDSMPDPNRPFQHYSEAELMDRKRQLRDDYKYHSGRLKGMSPLDDDRKAINDEISSIGRKQKEIEDELAARRKERQRG